jgi:outer membrane protein OmpA-like peptidoglycan-associated protein
MADKPAGSAKSPTPKTPAVAAPNSSAALPRTEPTPVPTPAAPSSVEPLPSAATPPEPSAAAPASAEPPASAAPEPAVAPPATVAPTETTPPPPPPPPPPPVAAGETPGPIGDVAFDLDSVRLNAAARTQLEGVVQQLKANPSLKVHIRGHSDAMGSREHNLELSRKRAASVENFLHGSGIPGSRITTEAMGGRKPVDANNTPSAWARNRRVEIEWR